MDENRVLWKSKDVAGGVKNGLENVCTQYSKVMINEVNSPEGTLREILRCLRESAMLQRLEHVSHTFSNIYSNLRLQP